MSRRRARVRGQCPPSATTSAVLGVPSDIVAFDVGISMPAAHPGCRWTSAAGPFCYSLWRWRPHRRGNVVWTNWMILLRRFFDRTPEILNDRKRTADAKPA